MTFDYKTPKYKDDKLFAYFKQCLQDSLSDDYKNFISDCATSICKAYPTIKQEEISSRLSKLKNILPLSEYPKHEEIEVMGLCDTKETQSIYYFDNIEMLKNGSIHNVLAHEIVHYMSYRNGNVSSYLSINEGCTQIISSRILDDLGIDKLESIETKVLYDYDKYIDLVSKTYGNGYPQETTMSELAFDIMGDQKVYEAFFNGEDFEIEPHMRTLDLAMKSAQDYKLNNSEITLTKIKMAYLPMYMEKYMEQNPGADYLQEYLRKRQELIESSPKYILESSGEKHILYQKGITTTSDVIACLKAQGLTLENAEKSVMFPFDPRFDSVCSAFNIANAYNIHTFDLSKAKIYAEHIVTDGDGLSQCKTQYAALVIDGKAYQAKLESIPLSKKYISEVYETAFKIVPLGVCDEADYQIPTKNRINVLDFDIDSPGIDPIPRMTLSKARTLLFLAEQEHDIDKICAYALISGMKIDDIGKAYPEVRIMFENLSLNTLSDKTLDIITSHKSLEFVQRLNPETEFNYDRILASGETLLSKALSNQPNDRLLNILYGKIEEFAQKPIEQQTKPEWRNTILDCDINSHSAESTRGLLDLTLDKFDVAQLHGDLEEQEKCRKIYEILLEKKIKINDYNFSDINNTETLFKHNDLAMFSIAVESLHSYRDTMSRWETYSIFNRDKCRELQIQLDTLHVVQNVDGTYEYGYIKDGEFVFGSDPRIISLAAELKSTVIPQIEGIDNKEALKTEIIQELADLYPSSPVIVVHEKDSDSYRLFSENDGQTEDFGLVPKLYVETYIDKVIESDKQLSKESSEIKEAFFKEEIEAIYDSEIKDDKEKCSKENDDKYAELEE